MKVHVVSKKMMSAKFIKLLFLFLFVACATPVRKIKRPLEALEKLQNTRNQHWFKVLRTRKEKKFFVGVGALHLIGPKSLIQIFRDKGATVERQN